MNEIKINHEIEKKALARKKLEDYKKLCVSQDLCYQCGADLKYIRGGADLACSNTGECGEEIPTSLKMYSDVQKVAVINNSNIVL